MGLSRREFVTATGAGALALGIPGGSLQAAIARRVGGRKDAALQEGIWIDALGGLRVSEEGFEEIKRSGLTMIETTLGAPGTPPFGYERAVRDLAEWHGVFDRFSDRLLRVRTTHDILAAKESGRFAVMLGFQNGTHLRRNIENVQFFYNLGIRQIQLTYNSLNALGAGCTARDDVGLSGFGVQVVEKMNELGMLVDLSHCGYRTTMDAIEVSEKPPIFSHTNCRALCDNPRCKTDEQIRALAGRGGVMGVTSVNFFVSKKPRSTLDDYVDHIEHVVQLVGIDHVGIGTDSSIGGWRVSFPTEEQFYDFHAQFHFKPEIDLRWPPFIEELDVPEKMYVIGEALERRGFSSSDVQKVLGGNFLRVYQQVLG
ncbi:MAG: dipeptidase [Gemmatimonadales bacterium]|nr:dipeptidase [Gemmatimonadales bacterium]